MITKPKLNHSHRRLFYLFPVIVVAAIIAISSSIDTTNGVTDKTKLLIDKHIPELGEVSALQVMMNQRIIMLQKYYETTIPPTDAQAAEINRKFNQHLANLQFLSLSQKQVAMLTQPTANFLHQARLFHEEMSKGPQRDWDKLRAHLAEASRYADEGNARLEAWTQKTRAQATQGAQQTLLEINRLSTLQLSFNTAIAVASVLLLAVLYARLKDQEKLFRRAHHDEVTGLPNRRALHRYAEDFLASDEADKEHAFMLISIDRFAVITGTFGHVLGDQLLKTFSQRLEKLVHESNTDARLFSFDRANWVICVKEHPELLPGKDVAQMIVDFAAQPLLENEREYNVSCSIGMSYYPKDASELEPLVACSDTARRAAIDKGGSCFRIYQAAMKKNAEHCLSMEMRIRAALQTQSFELHYQPKLEADGQSIASAEALIRWRQSSGFISPGEFIPVAETTGLIIPIGEWVIEQACRDWLAWQSAGLNPPPVAVNISAQQFQLADFPELVSRILADTQMPPEMLELEITEEASSGNPHQVVSAMNALKAIGVGIAIDDFGTGYSSLSYLKQFPVDVLKIDRAFVSQIETSEQDKAIVHMIIDMAHQLNFTVVAEGVETDAQWQTLQDLGCDVLQGFLFSRPLGVPDYAAYLAQDSRLLSDLQQEVS